MVEINNQRKAFLDMLAWSEGTDNGRPNQKSWLWRHCRRRAVADYSDHPRKLVTLNPKLKSTGAGRYQLLSRWWDAYRKQLGLKDTLEKSGRCWHCSRLRSVALYYDWSWWYPSGNRPLQQYLGFTAALVMVSSSIRLTAWLQNSKKRAERSERLMYEQSHRDYLRSGYLHHRLPVMGC